EHDAIAGGKRRAELPCSHEEREIPWNDLADNANRFAHCKGVEIRARRVEDADRDGVAFDFRRPASHVMEKIGGQRNIGDARDGAWFAVIQRLKLRKFVGVLEDDIPDAPDEFSTFGWRHGPPGS